MVNVTQSPPKLTRAEMFYRMGASDAVTGAVTRYFSATMFEGHADWQNYLAGLRSGVA